MTVIIKDKESVPIMMLFNVTYIKLEYNIIHLQENNIFEWKNINVKDKIVEIISI